MIFSYIVDILYPSVDRRYQATGFKPIINNATQKESPCNIPRKISIGPINSKSLSVLTSNVIFHDIINLRIKSHKFFGTRWISRHLRIHWCETES